MGRAAALLAASVTYCSQVAAADLTSVTDTLADTGAGKTTKHTISFTTVNTLPADGKIVIDFPSGFNVATAALVAPFVTGPDAGFTLTITNQSLTITRSGVGFANPFAAGTVTVYLTNIVNHATTGSYSVTVQTTDSTHTAIDGPTASSTFSITQSPIVTTSSGVTAFTEGGGPVAVDSAITVSDADSTTLASATVSITGAFQSAQDSLAFANNGSTMGNITGSYDASTGVLTLTSSGSSASVTQWQSALQSVNYSNTSESPETTTRTISFAVNDGTAASNSATKQLSVTAVNDAPIFTNLGGTVSFTEGGSAVVLDSDATIADAELDALNNYNGATLTVARNGAANVNDIFAFTSATVTASGGNLNVGGTTRATYSLSSGTLTITFNSNSRSSDADDILQAINYSNSSDVPPSSVTVNFTFSDGNSGTQGSGGALTATGSVTVNITAVNDAPTFANLNATPTFTENGSAVVLDSDATVSDAELDAANNYNGATLTLARQGGANADDVFGFTSPVVVSGNQLQVPDFRATFTQTGGTLTITFANNASPGEADQILQSITYSNSSDAPPSSVIISYTFSDGNTGSEGTGGALTATGSVTVTITAVNDAPVLADLATSVTFAENTVNAAEQLIDSTVTVTDVDSTNFNGGSLTVSYTVGGSSEDQLSIRNQGTNSTQIAFSGGNVTYGNQVFATASGGSNGTSLTVTFTNNDATPAAVEALIENLTYKNTSDTPAASRTISIAFSDGDGGTSSAQTVAISVTAENDAPVLANIEGTTLAYTENGSATAITSTLQITDAESSNLTGATVQITGNYASSEDVLSFDNTSTPNILGSFNTLNGTMTLSGTDTVANYQTAVRNVKYANTSDNPSVLTRTVTFQVTDGSTSNTTTRDIGISAVNDAPVLANIETAALSYSENASATAITSTLTVTDVDSTNLSGATVEITSNFASGEDVLSFDNTSTPNITGNFSSGTGRMTLTGSDSVANYQTALRNVKYSNTSDNPSVLTRTVSFQVNDGSGLNNTSNIATRNITVTAVNDAPVLADAAVTLNSVIEDAGPPSGFVGTQISSIVQMSFGLTNVTDVDASAATGIAITGADTANGSWFYSTDHGSTWLALGTVSSSSARLLAADANTVIYFQPNANFNGTISSALTFRAWDQTSGTNGALADTSVNGALTAFSSATDTASITVTAVNDAPAISSPGSSYTFSTVAGLAGSEGAVDAAGTSARFRYPRGVAVDASGNLYVTDTGGNNTIRKITPAGDVTTFAGTAATSGSTDATGASARFTDPTGIVVDSSGNVFVSEGSNHTIRKITSAGVVSTFAGLAGSTNSTDATGTAARFNSPAGLAIDSMGNIYVADSGNHRIRKISSSGVVTTLAGSGTPGSADGTGTGASFNSPSDVAVDSSGNVYVADRHNHVIRKITASGVVSTLAGLAGSTGSTDGVGTAARFNQPQGIAVDSAGDVYVSEYDNHTIRKVTISGTVTTLGGVAGSIGNANGAGTIARFQFPGDITVDSSGTLYIADTGNHTIRKGATGASTAEDAPLVFSSSNSNLISISDIDVGESAGTGLLQVTLSVSHGTLTLSGTTGLSFSFSDANGTGAGTGTTNASMSFRGSLANVNTALNSLTYQPASNYHGSDTLTITSSDLGNVGTGGVLTDSETISITVTSVNDAPVLSNATVTADPINEGAGAPVGAVGTLVSSLVDFATPSGGRDNVTDVDTGAVTGIAVISVGTLNGTWHYSTDNGATWQSFGTVSQSAARLLAADTSTRIYFQPNNADANGTVTGSLSFRAWDQTSGVNGGTADATFPSLVGGATAFSFDSVSVSITINPVNDAPVNVFAGAIVPNFLTKFGASGTADLQFSSPRGIAVDSSGNLYVADLGNHRIQKFDSSGNFIRKWGSNGTGNGQFDSPHGLAVDALGNVYVVELGNHRIQKFDSSGNHIVTWGSNGSGPLQFSSPQGIAVDSAGNVYVADTGNHRIQQLNSSGGFVREWGSSGTGSGQFSSPSAIALDSAGNVYVTDFGNHRVQKFSSTGAFLLAWGSSGSGAGQFTNPSRITVDGAGNVYVTDNGNHRIQKFENDGDFISQWGSNGSADGQFSFPTGIAVDGFGNIYITDFGNSRIQKFASGLAVMEDNSLVFSASNANAITVTDVDAGTGSVKVALTVTHGKLTLGSTSGVTFSSGTTNGGSNLEIVGSLTSLNTALDGLTYTPPSNFNGSDTLTITSNDQGNTGGSPLSDSDSLLITITAVNDAPVLADANVLLSAITEDAGAPVGFTGTQIASIVQMGFGLTNVTDVDSAGLTGIAVTAADSASGTWWYTTNHGSTWLTLGAVSVSGARLLAADSNTAIYFQPNTNFNGTIASALTFRAWDQSSGANGGTADTTSNGGVTAFSSATDTASITVSAVNDAPVNTVPLAQTVNEDTAKVFSSSNANLISVADVDAGTNVVKVTLAASHGTLTLPGTTGLTFVTGFNNGGLNVQFSGMLSDINAALNGLSYLPSLNYNGSDTITITSNDQGNTGGGALSDTKTIAITINPVNDPPVVATNAGLTVSEGGSGIIGAGELSIVDVDNVDTNLVLTVVTAPASGSLKKMGTALGAGATFTQADLATGFHITYEHNGAETLTDQFTFTVADGSGGTLGSQQFTITVIPVNDPPVNTVPLAQTTAEDTARIFSSTNSNLIAVADADSGTNAIKVVLNVFSGTLTLNGTAGLTFTNGDGTNDSTLEFSGTVSAINSALNGLAYVPLANFNGSDTLTLVSNDQGHTGSSTAPVPLSDTDTVAITVTPVNDAPVLSTAPSPILEAVFEDAPAPAGFVGTPVGAGWLVDQFGGLTNVFDPDLGAQLGIAIIGAATANGTWHYSLNSGSTWQPLGTVSETTARLLAGDGSTRIYFQPNANFNGTIADAITFRAWDRTTGSNGGTADTSGTNNAAATAFSSASDTASINVIAVNDPPVVAVPAAQVTNEDTAKVFSSAGSNAISISDVDAGANAVRITLGAFHGTLTLSATNGLTFLNGTVNASGNLEFSGSLSNVNSALNGLSYLPRLNFNGADTLTITANDQGNTGGSPLFDVESVAITVNAVNDAPVLNPSASPVLGSTPEDSPAPSGFTGTPVGFGWLIDPFGGLSNVSDADPDAQFGIAIVGADSTNGTWWFTTDNGGVWTQLGAVSSASARLLLADGQTRLYFQPNANFNGTITNAITFRAWDRTTGGSGALANTDGTNNGGITAFSTATDTASITVTEVNDPPVAINDARTIAEDTTLTVSTLDLLSNDLKAASGITNEASQTLTIISVAPTGDTRGTVSLQGTNITFVPALDFNGTAAFHYTVQDNGTTSGFADPKQAVGTVTVTITAVNDPPVAGADFRNTIEDVALVLPLAELLSNDAPGPATATDELSQVLSIIAVSTPAHGTVTLTSTNLTYTPALNYHGSDSFTYTVQDTGTTSGADAFKTATGTVNVTVSAVNDPPTIGQIPNQTINEDQATPAIAFTVGDVETSVTNLVLSTSVDNGKLVPLGSILLGGSGANRTITVTPGANQFGTANITVTVHDQDGLAASTNFVLTVNGVIDGSPLVFNTTAEYKVQTTGGLTIERNPADGPEVTHFQITEIVGGKVFRPNGTNEITNNQFITADEGFIGLKFTPDIVGTASFKAQASTSSVTSGLGGTKATLTITVTKARQHIAFAPPAPVLFQSGLQVPLSATASSGLPVAYEVFGPATVSNNVVSVQAAGDILVLASQAGDANYHAAPSVVQTLSILRAPQTITFNLGVGPDLTYGAPPVPLTATATSGLPVRYSITGPGFRDLNNQLVITGVGTIIIVAEQDGDDTFLAAPAQIRSLNVGRANLTVRANNASRFVGAPDPIFTAEITGLRNNDLIEVDFSTTATPQSQPGPYTITPHVQDPANRLGNYDLTPVPGTLTVEPKPAPVPETIPVTALEDTPRPIDVVTSPDLLRSGSPLRNLTLQTRPTNGVLLAFGPDTTVGLASSAPTTIAAPTGPMQATYIPNPDANGPDSFSVLYEYVSGISVLRTFELQVAPKNDPPRLAPIPDMAIRQSGQQIVVPLHGIAAGPTNEFHQPITITVVSETPSLIEVPSNAVNYTSPDTFGSLTLNRVGTASSGRAVIRVTVSDGESVDGTFSRSFGVEITARAVRIGVAEGMLGTPVDVPIDLHATGNENSVAFTVKFDSVALEFVEVAPGSGLNGSQLNVNSSQASAGQIGVAVARSVNTSFAAGVHHLVTLKLRVRDDVDFDVERNLPLLFFPVPVLPQVADTDARAVPAAFESSHVRITRGFEADVTPRPFGKNTGDIVVNDWQLIGALFIGLEDIQSASEFQRADVAPRESLGDGQLDLTDWVQAGRYSVKFDTTAGLTPRAGGPVHPSNGTAALASAAPSSKARLMAAPGARTIRLERGAVQGAKAVALVSLDAQGDENAVSFSLKFDPAKASFKEARLSADAAGAILLSNTRSVKEGRVGVALALPAGKALSAGKRTIVEVEFELVAGGPGFAEVRFADAPVAQDVASVDARKLAASFSATAVLIGDTPPAIELDPVDLAKAGEMTLRLSGKSGESFVIEASEDLLTWKVLKQITLNGSSAEYVDAESRRLPGRFYRIKRAPVSSATAQTAETVK